MFLSVVHLRELRCVLCREVLAVPGARSFIVDSSGEPVPFSADGVPERMLLEIVCSRGHVTQVAVPDDVAAEEVLTTPDDAPVGRDAVLQ